MSSVGARLRQALSDWDTLAFNIHQQPFVSLERPEIETAMKIFGAFALLIGLVMMIFAVFAYSELHSAATAATTPSPDSMPLTKIVGPELFDPEHAATRPAELASMAFNRIYIIGGVSLISLALGVLQLMTKQTPKSLVVRADEAEQTSS
jgi:hypothetical protein